MSKNKTRSYNDTWNRDELGDALKTIDKDKKKHRDKDDKKSEVVEEEDKRSRKKHEGSEERSSKKRNDDDEGRSKDKDRHRDDKYKKDDDEETRHRRSKTSERHKDKESEKNDDDDKHRRHKRDNDDDKKKDDDSDEERRRRRRQKEKEKEKEKKSNDADEDGDKKHRRKHRDSDDERKKDDSEEERRRRRKQREKEKEKEEEKEKRDRESSKKDKPEDDSKSKHKDRKKDEEFLRRVVGEDSDDDRKERKKRDKDKKEKVKDTESLKIPSASTDKGSKKSEEKIVDDYYDDDFDDFVDDDDDDDGNAKKEAKKNKSESDDDSIKYSKNKFKGRPESKTKESYNKYDSDEDYNRNNEKIMRAHKQVNIPTDDVRVYKCEVQFNLDSIDRQRRRAKDLRKLIELDHKTFNLFELNPYKMSTVYSANAKHERTQTNEDIDEVGIQTDEIENVNKWTQNPPTDSKGFGGDRPEADFDFLAKFRIDSDIHRMQEFLLKSTKLIETILREKKVSENKEILVTSKSQLEFSKGYAKTTVPDFLNDSLVANCEFCSNDPQYFVSNFNCKYNCEDINKSIFLVYNVDELNIPYRVLNLEGISSCCCFTSTFVFSGNNDGTVAVWDTREPDSLHKFTKSKRSNEVVLRTPTYTTAGVLQYENHSSEVQCVKTLQSQMTTKEDGALFMQLATLEHNCKLIIWTVVELNEADLGASGTDLGLLPGGKVKLVKSSQINLNSLTRTYSGNIDYATLWMGVPINDTNNFYICTDIGQIVHISRSGELCSPSAMKSKFTDGILQVKCLAFHHEMQDVLLAGYGNGELRLYHSQKHTALNQWFFACGTNSVEKIEWLKCKLSSALILDSESIFYLWDFLVDDTKPILKSQYDHSVVSASLSSFAPSGNNDIETEGSNCNKLVICDAKNKVKLHVLKPEYTQMHKKERKHFEKLIKGYLMDY